MAAACLFAHSGLLITAQTPAYGSDFSDDWVMYEEFSENMQHWGYEWEPFKVETEDGFVLTTFHITGKTEGLIKKDPSLMPVMFMSGYGGDATDWVSQTHHSANNPMVFRLVEDGFDVYLASNRGTQYCQEHLTLSINSPEYWAWSWAEMGIYDDVANIKVIQERTGAAKVSYVGNSQGST